MANQDPMNDPRDSDRVVLTPAEARQGNLGRPVLYVLILGLLLAIVAWTVVGGWGRAIAPETPNNSAVDVPAVKPATEPMTDPAANNGVMDNNPAPGVKREPEPAVVDPQPTGNQ